MMIAIEIFTVDTQEECKINGGKPETEVILCVCVLSNVSGGEMSNTVWKFLSATQGTCHASTDRFAGTFFHV